MNVIKPDGAVVPKDSKKEDQLCQDSETQEEK